MVFRDAVRRVEVRVPLREPLGMFLPDLRTVFCLRAISSFVRVDDVGYGQAVGAVNGCLSKISFRGFIF